MRMCRSPKLFAAYRVLHRLLMPRHSPCALFSLTFVGADFVSFAFVLAQKLTRSVAPPLEIKTFVLISQLAWSLISCSQNYAGSTKKNLQNCVTLKVPHFTISNNARYYYQASPSVALLFVVTLFSFQGAGENTHNCVPSKLNNVRLRKGLTWECYEALAELRGLLRKEVIQPHLPIRLPCYDFTPITKPTFGRALLAVRLRTSGVPGSHGVTGGVYKARERIHRGMLIRDY